MKIQKNDFSHLSSSDNSFIDSLYSDYKSNPESVDETWRQFFRGFEYRMGSDSGASASGEQFHKEFSCLSNDSILTEQEVIFLSDTNPIRPEKR
jgi:2-oxoglutarate dehydrogenase E1 component